MEDASPAALEAPDEAPLFAPDEGTQRDVSKRSARLSGVRAVPAVGLGLLLLGLAHLAGLGARGWLLEGDAASATGLQETGSQPAFQSPGGTSTPTSPIHFPTLSLPKDSYTILTRIRNSPVQGSRDFEQILAWGSCDKGRTCVELRLTPEGDLEFTTGETTPSGGTYQCEGQTLSASPNVDLADNQYHDVAVVYEDVPAADEGMMYLYLDGKMVAHAMAKGLENDISPDHNCRSARYCGASVEYSFNGEIGDVSIYQEMFSGERLQALHDGPLLEAKAKAAAEEAAKKAQEDAAKKAADEAAAKRAAEEAAAKAAAEAEAAEQEKQWEAGPKETETRTATRTSTTTATTAEPDTSSEGAKRIIEQARKEAEERKKRSSRPQDQDPLSLATVQQQQTVVAERAMALRVKQQMQAAMGPEGTAFMAGAQEAAAHRAWQSADPEVLKESAALFHRLDADHDGSLSASEIGVDTGDAGHKFPMSLGISDAELVKIFDKDGDGEVDIHEFLVSLHLDEAAATRQGDYQEATGSETTSSPIVASDANFFLIRSNGEKSLAELDQSCRKMGGAIASILSPEEDAQAKATCGEKKVCYIGLEYQGDRQTGQWHWHDGQPYLSEGCCQQPQRSFHDYAAKEPSSGVQEPCTVIWLDKKWHDAPCPNGDSLFGYQYVALCKVAHGAGAAAGARRSRLLERVTTPQPTEAVRPPQPPLQPQPQPTPRPQPPRPQSDPVVFLRSWQEGTCLEQLSGTHLLELRECDASRKGGGWTLTSGSGNALQLRTSGLDGAPDLCLRGDEMGGAGDVSDCGDYESQNWSLLPQGDYYWLVNFATHRCLARKHADYYGGRTQLISSACSADHSELLWKVAVDSPAAAAAARGRACEDGSATCREWMRDGQCGANPRPMFTQCAASCNVCLLDSMRYPAKAEEPAPEAMLAAPVAIAG